MGLGHPVGAHLVEDHAYPGIRCLPGRFRASKAAADDMHGLKRGLGACHGQRGSAFRGAVECVRPAGYDNARNSAGVIRLKSGLKPLQPL